VSVASAHNQKGGPPLLLIFATGRVPEGPVITILASSILASEAAKIRRVSAGLTILGEISRANFSSLFSGDVRLEFENKYCVPRIIRIAHRRAFVVLWISPLDMPKYINKK
jgi:hypothetical protein